MTLVYQHITDSVRKDVAEQGRQLPLGSLRVNQTAPTSEVRAVRSNGSGQARTAEIEHRRGPLRGPQLRLELRLNADTLLPRTMRKERLP